MANSDSYDAIIIGAGIGGLVCGCYLAKAGMKVLICEQHYKPGGYCTSFKRGQFTFDAAPHCFGAYREGGITRKIFQDLGIDKKLNIIRPDPTDIVITPDYKIHIWNNLDRTIEEFQIICPSESNNIKNFFYFLFKADPVYMSKIRMWTFKILLDSYFNNEKLKAVISLPLLAMAGLPSSLMSAFMGVRFYSEFFLDGGYYPIGGMQLLSDAIAERFKEFGGELRLSCLVKKIRVKDNKVIGVVTEKDGFIPSPYVISNCDARQTFLKLLGKDKIKKEFYITLKNMIPSISNFIAYLGLNNNFSSVHNPGTAIFYSSHYDIEKAYQSAIKGDIEKYGGYALRVDHNKTTMNVIVPVSYKNRVFWNNNKYKTLKLIIDIIEKTTIPDLSKHIIFREAASPLTLYRYTLNYKGASYGWASLPSQLAIPDLQKPSFIKGLYLTGHWTTLGLGIPGVFYVGYDTYKLITQKRGKS